MNERPAMTGRVVSPDPRLAKEYAELGASMTHVAVHTSDGADYVCLSTGMPSDSVRHRDSDRVVACRSCRPAHTGCIVCGCGGV